MKPLKTIKDWEAVALGVEPHDYVPAIKEYLL